MTTKRLVFERLGPPVQSLITPKTDRERVIDHMVERYAISQFEAEARYCNWENINQLRETLGIKDQ